MADSWSRWLSLVATLRRLPLFTPSSFPKSTAERILPGSTIFLPKCFTNKRQGLFVGSRQMSVRVFEIESSVIPFHYSRVIEKSGGRDSNPK